MRTEAARALKVTCFRMSKTGKIGFKAKACRETMLKLMRHYGIPENFMSIIKTNFKGMTK